LSSKFEEFFLNDIVSAFLDVIKLLSVIFFIAHWVACFFFFVSDSELDNEPFSWVVQTGLSDASNFEEKYITSLYWAFTTMTTVGYGDVFPMTMAEQLYGIISMIVACGVFAYVVGSIGTIVNRSSTIIQDFKDKVLHINQFMVQQHLPKEFRRKVKRYFDYLAEYKRQYKIEEEDVLDMLSENLRL